MSKIRVVCLSDTHNDLDLIKVPDGDLLIHAGDATINGTVNEMGKFFYDLEQLPHQRKIICAGNHDWLWQRDKYTALASLPERTIYLEDDFVVLNGLKIYGSPHTPTFFNWAFNQDSARLYDIWQQVPDDVDIMITHGPPYGILDSVVTTKKKPYKGAANTNSTAMKAFQIHERAGCLHLRERMDEVEPLVHIFGHIHSAYGIDKLGNTTYINAALMDEMYEVAHKPVVFDINDGEVEIIDYGRKERRVGFHETRLYTPSE